jgi:hypothetical protein
MIKKRITSINKNKFINNKTAAIVYITTVFILLYLFAYERLLSDTEIPKDISQ